MNFFFWIAVGGGRFGKRKRVEEGRRGKGGEGPQKMILELGKKNKKIRTTRTHTADLLFRSGQEGEREGRAPADGWRGEGTKEM